MGQAIEPFWKERISNQSASACDGKNLKGWKILWLDLGNWCFSSFQSPESKFALGQEDCLYLNVFTPQLPGAGISPIYPVIVWVHGGAFCVGSNDSRIYGPEYLLDYGVVLVTINYR